MTDFTLGPGPLTPEFEQVKSDIGIVENGNTATHAIPSGYYVIWKGDLYVAKTDISSGTALSAESNGNLTAKSTGIGGEVKTLYDKFGGMTLYFGCASLGLSTGSSLLDIYNAATPPCVVILNASDVAAADRVGTSSTWSSGYIQIVKSTNARSRIFYYHKTNVSYDRCMAITSENAPSGVWEVITGSRKIEWYTLLGTTELTSSYVVTDTYSLRKFSDYEVIFCVFYLGEWEVGSVVSPRSKFVTDTGISYITNSSDGSVEFDVKYASDTSVSIKKITSSTKKASVMICGISYG